jgi:hypothetical protein
LKKGKKEKSQNLVKKEETLAPMQAVFGQSRESPGLAC